MFKFIKRIMKYAGEYRKKLNVAYVLSFFESLMADVPIFLVIYAIIQIVNKAFTNQTIIILAVGIVAGIILRMIFRYAIDVNQSGVGFEIFARERMSLGDRLKRLPMGFFSESNIGNVTSVIANDINFVEEQGMEVLGKITSALLGIAITAVFMIFFDWRLALVVIGTVALFLPASHLMIKASSDEARKMQDTQKDLTGSVIEYIKGIPVVKAFNLAGKSCKNVNTDFYRMSETQLNYERRLTPIIFVIKVITALGIAGVVVVTGILFNKNAMILPYAVAMTAYAIQVVAPLLALLGIDDQIRVANASLDRYDNVTNTKLLDSKGKDITLNKFDIDFNSVDFAYGKNTESENSVLKNISFNVKEHSMTALVGKSGCGKSTIVNLIARFWDVNKGSIKIGGVDVKEMTTESLLKNISVVFQNVYLFNDTIYNNIAFGKKDATREEIIEACKKARCHDFIQALPDGYETVVGEGGSTLSGGEKQRISIARAILKDAPIVLLDEATASIDPDNEAYIQQAISEMVKGKTLVVIAHKLSSIVNADQILMIEDGKIVERGTHDELLQNKSSYFKLWERRQNSRGWKISGK